MMEPRVLSGKLFSDTRGKLFAFKNFDLSEIVRCYEILPSSISVIRAWQAHQEEKKWFYCLAGAFIVNLIKIDNFEKPSEKLVTAKFCLRANKPKILAVPGGYANGFRSLEPDSRLMVYSNFTIEESGADDYRYQSEKWNANWQFQEGATNDS